MLVTGIILLLPNLSNPAEEASVESWTHVKHHTISITLFPAEHGFKAADNMAVEHSGGKASLRLNKSFTVLAVSVDDKNVEFHFDSSPDDKTQKAGMEGASVSDLSRAGALTFEWKKAGEHTVRVLYKGTIYEEPSASSFSREYIASQTTGVISGQGTFLSPECFWYPQGDERMSQFEVMTTTPAGYETVTQGTRLSHEIKEGWLAVHWKNPHPADVLYLQAGPYTVQEEEISGIKVYTYFFPGGEALADTYLKKSKQYIAMYNSLLGRYPYSKFAVVENFFETGYGMPSWTLLGKTVVRLPFIPDTSLPHEICHNWWGNGVFVDYEQGNWCEGLTVYCADYLLKKKMYPGGDVDYRRQVNRDYASYVQENNDFPLASFRARHNPASRAVGYDKAMMVFHDLQRRVGEERFFAGLRLLMTEYAFQQAGWQDVLAIFEKECSLTLEDFYRQWVEQAGAPVLRLKKVSCTGEGAEYRVSFTLVQEGRIYTLIVPVRITTKQGTIERDFQVARPNEIFSLLLDAKPIRLEVDPDSHLFRRLFPEEIPPSIARVFGSPKQMIVLSSEKESEGLALYREAARMINKTGTARILIDTDAAAEDLSSQSVILIGTPLKGIPAAEFLQNIRLKPPWDPVLAGAEEAASVVICAHPKLAQDAVMVITPNNRSDLLAVVRKLPHYGKYSYLLFHGGENVAKGIWEVSQSPLIHAFGE